MRYTLLLLLFIGSELSANELRFNELRFVSVDEPPANFLNERGGVNGYVAEIIKELQKQLKIDNEIEVMPEARALHTLDANPNVVMFSISRTPEREQKYHWLAHVLTKRWIFYSLHDSPLDVSSLEQVIHSRTIGVVRGDIREKWLQERQASKLVRILNYNNAIEMLLMERIDLLFYESFGVYGTLKKLGYKSNMIKSQFVANASNVYIVMSKTVGSEVMAEALQSRLTELKKSKWYQANTKRWVDDLNRSGGADAWVFKGILHY